MDLYFAGAEQPLYMRTLVDLDVKHIAVSFFEWQRRHSNDDLYKHIPAEVSVCITPGIAKKVDIDFKSFADDYVEFAERNAEQSIVFDFDAPSCPLPLRQEVRRHLSVLPNVVMFPFAEEEPASLAKDYERVGINARLGKSIPTNELRRIPATLYGSNITNPAVLKGARFEATTSFAWLSARRYGELWVFNRGRLRHYGADKLAAAVRANREAIEGLGVDPRACLANDPAALVAVAVKSLQMMAQTLSRRPRDRQEGEAAAATGSGALGDPTASRGTAPAISGSPSALEPLIVRERKLLPVASLNMEDGEQKVASVGGTLRTCDSCNLADACPEVHENAMCAFEFPVEIQTEQQWQAASHYLLEVQMQRIAFAQLAEQLDGNVLSPRLGQEMDRFLSMSNKIKDLEQKPAPPEGGALSRFFPSAPTGDVTPQLGSSNGNEEDEVEEGDFIEAEVLGDEDSWPEGEQVGDGNAYVEENAPA